MFHLIFFALKCDIEIDLCTSFNWTIPKQVKSIKTKSKLSQNTINFHRNLCVQFATVLSFVISHRFSVLANFCSFLYLSSYFLRQIEQNENIDVNLLQTIQFVYSHFILLIQISSEHKNSIVVTKMVFYTFETIKSSFNWKKYKCNSFYFNLFK